MKETESRTQFEFTTASDMKSYRATALKLLEKCKERERHQDLVHIRIDKNTVLLMDRKKAIRKGYIKE